MHLDGRELTISAAVIALASVVPLPMRAAHAAEIEAAIRAHRKDAMGLMVGRMAVVLHTASTLLATYGTDVPDWLQRDADVLATAISGARKPD